MACSGIQFQKGLSLAFNFDKYARRYLGGYCFRFNRRFAMAAMTERIANAVCCCMPRTERDLRIAESYG
jgi:shikimate kinase